MDAKKAEMVSSISGVMRVSLREYEPSGEMDKSCDGDSGGNDVGDGYESGSHGVV